MPLGDPASPSVPRFRGGFPRPSFMTLTVALALIITPSVGLLAAELRDPKAESELLAREGDLALRGDLLEQGFAPLSSTADPSILALSSLGIEVLTPER